MRLVCPNCDAEYEVDASVIPDGGRDVQCSNCGHAWFQLSPEVEAEIAAEEALYEAPPAPAPIAKPDDMAERAAPDTIAPIGFGVEDESDLATDAAEGASGDVRPPAAAAEMTAALPRRSIDESVLAVLREEAERETEARKAEAPALETQTEMGLAAAPASAGLASTIASRLARLKGEDLTPPAPVKPQTRREMFPEIEEINSTLRASTERRSGAAAGIAESMEPQPKGSGFRTGFVLMLVIAVLLVAVYAMAPRLSQQFPAAAGSLTSFVALMDQARIFLDGLIKSAIDFLHGLAGSST